MSECNGCNVVIRCNEVITYVVVGAAAGADAMFVRNVFLYMLPTFVEAIQQEMDAEVLNVMLASFVKVCSPSPSSRRKSTHK